MTEDIQAVFRILQITDTHLWADPAAVYRDWQTDQSLQEVIKHALETGPEPDAVLLSGDLAHDEEPETYRRLREHISAFSAPIWALPGNHDDPETLRANLGPDLYLGHCDIPGWRVILLNSHQPGQDGGCLSDNEIQRLQRLSEDCETACMVVIHHPAWRVGSAWLDCIGLANGDETLELLDSHPQVRVLLCGHIHQVYDRRHGHIRLLGTPSTCRQFLPGCEEFAEDAQPPGYRWLFLYPDGRFATRIVRVPAAAKARQEAQGIS